MADTFSNKTLSLATVWGRRVGGSSRKKDNEKITVLEPRTEFPSREKKAFQFSDVLSTSNIHTDNQPSSMSSNPSANKVHTPKHDISALKNIVRL